MHDIGSSQLRHIKGILAAISTRFQTAVGRESLVPAHSKRVARGARFQRVGRNTFSLHSGPSP